MMALSVVSGLAGVEMEGESFKGKNLRHADLRGSTFTKCDFDDADMSYVDGSRSKFLACTFRNTILYRANFMDAKLGASVFEPRDCFGMTVTLECSTFKNLRVSQQWFYIFLMFATQMLPASGPVKDNLHDKLVAMIGAERYVRLKALFEQRQL